MMVERLARKWAEYRRTCPNPTTDEDDVRFFLRAMADEVDRFAETAKNERAHYTSGVVGVVAIWMRHAAEEGGS